jgi:hypothetical protein
MVYLTFSNALTILEQWMIGWLANTELEIMGKEAAMAWCNVQSYLPRGTTENTKDLSCDIWCLDWYLNLGSSKHEAGQQSTQLWWLMLLHLRNMNATNGRIVVTQVLMPLCIPKLCSDSMALRVFICHIYKLIVSQFKVGTPGKLFQWGYWYDKFINCMF